MPPRISYELTDSGIDNGAHPPAVSRQEKLYHFLLDASSTVNIVYWIVVGGFLMLLPWQSFWENNLLLFRFPHLRPLITNPFLKWAVFGLGIVNLLIGLEEIIHFRKGRGSDLAR